MGSGRKRVAGLCMRSAYVNGDGQAVPRVKSEVVHRFPTPARTNLALHLLSLFPSAPTLNLSDWRWPCAHAHRIPRISEIDASYNLDMTGQQSSWWSRVSGTGKVGFDKAWNLVDKLGAPVNKLSNKLGSEAFWPTTLDKESDKAARILRSFCSMSQPSHPPCAVANLPS